MKEIAVVVGASLLTFSTGTVAASAKLPSAAALSLQRAGSPRAGARTELRNNQGETGALALAAAGVAAAVLFYVLVVDESTDSDSD